MTIFDLSRKVILIAVCSVVTACATNSNEFIQSASGSKLLDAKLVTTQPDKYLPITNYDKNEYAIPEQKDSCLPQSLVAKFNNRQVLIAEKEKYLAKKLNKKISIYDKKPAYINDGIENASTNTDAILSIKGMVIFGYPELKGNIIRVVKITHYIPDPNISGLKTAIAVKTLGIGLLYHNTMQDLYKGCYVYRTAGLYLEKATSLATGNIKWIRQAAVNRYHLLAYGKSYALNIKPDNINNDGIANIDIKNIVSGTKNEDDSVFTLSCDTCQVSANFPASIKPAIRKTYEMKVDFSTLRQKWQMAQQKQQEAERLAAKQYKEMQDAKMKRLAFLNSPKGRKLRNRRLIDLSSDGAAAGSCTAFFINTIGRRYGNTTVNTVRASQGLNRAGLYKTTDSYSYYNGFTVVNNRFQNQEVSDFSITKALSDCSQLGFY